MKTLSGPVGSIFHPEHFQVNTFSKNSDNVLISFDLFRDFTGKTPIFKDQPIEKVDKIFLIPRFSLKNIGFIRYKNPLSMI